MGSIESENTFHCDVLIVGAGFSGIYGLHKLRQNGLNVKVFEAGSDIGGTWHWNRYPGARVDSEWPYYQLHLPEVWRDFCFTERFPGRHEINRYFAHADHVLGLKKDIHFNARVNSATWDAGAARWKVQTEAGHVGIAKYLCLFTGLLHRQYSPDFPGLDRYKGKVYHSAAWPEDVDMTGKKVAVIGSGATGVQIVQELAKQADQLTMFMRRPSICMPTNNRTVTEAEQNSSKPYYPIHFNASRKSATGFPVPRPTRGIFELSDAEREAYYEQLWKFGGFHFGLGNFREVYVNRRANRLAYDFWAKKTRARMTDPVKRDLMAPIEPPYPILTKRSPLETGYYEALDQDNVEVSGIITEDGKLQEFDYIVLATGFDSFTGSVAAMNVKSKDGVDIKDVWKDGIRTYLGMLIHGFPNCFLSYSPHAPTPFSNGPTILECQIDFITDIIAKMEQDGLDTVEPTAQAEEAWRQRIVDTSSGSLFAETDSWWVGTNIPGRKKEMMIYAYGIHQYEQECRATLDDWKGFDVRKQASLCSPVHGRLGAA